MKVSTKALKWRSALSEVEKIKDGVGLGVEPEVMELVAAMRLHHFRTTASCAGHLDRITSGPFVRFEKGWNVLMKQKRTVNSLLSVVAIKIGWKEGGCILGRKCIACIS